MIPRKRRSGSSGASTGGNRRSVAKSADGSPAASAAGRGARRPARESRPPVAGGRHRRRDEEVFLGRHACEAIFATRPDAIRRVYVDAAGNRRFRELLTWCAAHRRGFQVVDAESLRRLTGSLHHEGIAILAQAIRRWTIADLLPAIEQGGLRGPLLYLDGVSNPHNLGSILRTAAHFGVGCVMGRAGEIPALSPSTARVAEGAAEIVPVCDLADPVADLGRLEREGYRLIATASGRGNDLFGGRVPERVILAMGSEGRGVSPAILARADCTLRIPGTGAVESLNVAVACGVALAEMWRRSHGS